MGVIRFSVALLAFLAAFVQAEDTIRLSAPTDHPVREVAIRVLTLAYAELGYQLEAVSLPAARSLHMANEGLVDGELFRGNSIEVDFKQLIRIPVVIDKGEIVAIVDRNRDDIYLDSWLSLAPYRVGAQLGIKTIQVHTEGYNVEYVAEAEQLLLQILHGRTDVAVGPQSVFLQALNHLILTGVNDKLPLADIKFIEPPIETDDLFHYLHESNMDLAVGITRVLTRLEQEGVIARIRNEVLLDRYPALEQLHY
jgi:polar amino acid transport system substrate-binding protein